MMLKAIRIQKVPEVTKITKFFKVYQLLKSKHGWDSWPRALLVVNSVSLFTHQRIELKNQFANYFVEQHSQKNCQFPPLSILREPTAYNIGIESMICLCFP